MMKSDQQKSSNRPNQIFSQILLPFIIAFFSIAVAGYFLFYSLVLGTSDFRVWSDISVAIIFLPFILIGPLLFMLMIAKIVFIVMLQQKVVELGEKLRLLFNKAAGAAAILTNLSTKPLIEMKSGFSFLNEKK